MKPLATNQRVFTWFFIHPADENVGNRQKILYAMFSIFCVGTMMSFCVASLMFFLRNISTDWESSLFAFLQTVGIIGALYMIVLAFIMRRKIAEIFKSLSDIWNTYKHEDSFRFLSQANAICEWMWQIYFKYIIIGSMVVVVAVCAFSALISWLIYGFSDNFSTHLLRPCKLIFPWNEQTLLGYFSTVLFDAAIAGCYYITNGALLLLFISLCLFHRSFHGIFHHSLGKREFSVRYQKHKVFLRHLIRFHNSIEALFLDSAKAYSPFIMVQLICYIIYLAVTVFHLDMQLQSIDFGLFIVLIELVTGISNLFIYCFFGKLATESFEKMVDCLYDTDWYELPVDLQMYFVIMIQNGQQPLYYYGFGVAVLNLITFTKFMKTVFSYYMILKTLASK